MIPILNCLELSNPSIVKDFVHLHTIENNKYCVVSNFCNDDVALLSNKVKQLDFFNSVQLFNSTISLGEITNETFDDLQVNEKKTANRKFKMINATSDEFNLHTDCVYHKNPIDCLLLYCVENSQEGGANTLLFIDDLLKGLNSDEIELLKQPIFPYRHGFEPILKEEKGNRISVRYNRHGIGIASTILNVELSDIVISVLNKIDNILCSSKNVVEYKLKPDEILFINNKYCLHGRKAFDSNSARLLKRMRLFVD